jgi:hypothetical protein
MGKGGQGDAISDTTLTRRAHDRRLGPRGRGRIGVVPRSSRRCVRKQAQHVKKRRGSKLYPAVALSVKFCAHCVEKLADNARRDQQQF